MMARTFERLRFHLSRFGRVGGIGALLIVGSLAYLAGVVQPRAAALDAQLRSNAETARAAETERARHAAAAASESEQPTLAPAAAAALRRLFDAATAAGLELPQGEYRLTEIRDAHLRRYQLLLPVSGTYPEIRVFIAKALNTDPALALAAIQLRRDRIEDTELEAMLNFTLYLGADA